MGGEWVVKSVKSPVNVEISDGKGTRVVHTNRLHHCYIPGAQDLAAQGSTVDEESVIASDWAPPIVDHFILPPTHTTATSRLYPERQRRPPDRYQS